MKYIGAKFTIDEQFNVPANPFSRNKSDKDIAPGIEYYSISGTGVIYGSEDYAKRQSIIDAGILNVVYYDPDVYPSHIIVLNDNDWYSGSDYLYTLSNINGVLGRELTEKTSSSSHMRTYTPGEAYHKIQRTVQTTLPVDYDQLRVDDENVNTSTHSTTLSGSGGSYEYVVYDMFSSGSSSTVSFDLESTYRPFKNGQLNVLCDQDFSITVHTEHTIIFGMSDSDYEAYKPVMEEWIDIYNVWFIDDDAPFINTMPKLIESSPDPNVVWLSGIQWDAKTWPGLTSFTSNYGVDMWSDGTNFYCSYYDDQYVLDKTTGTWSPKTWNGLTSFSGRYIWTDGTNIYYSNGYSQYVLDPSTSTWSSKSWTGLRSFYGTYVWKSETGGIYYSNASDQYVLNKNTGAWVKKTWSGVSQPSGIYIWSDGVDTYYSNTSAQYVVNTSTSKWVKKTWTGLKSFDGRCIWTYKDDIYYSKGTDHYVLDKKTYTWIPKTWIGLTSFNGQNIWSYDDSNMYYSYGSDQYELHYPIPYRLSYLSMNESENLGDKWLIDNDIPYRIDFTELKESIDLNDSWLIDDDIPYLSQFPEFKVSIPVGDTWLISNGIPFRIEFSDLLKSASGPDSWLQDKGWDPRRPWPEHRSIIQKVQTIPNIPDVDWTKSMQQTFEFYTVDPNNWYDDQKLENIISCDLTHDLTSDKRGNASIMVTEPLPECYIRTYLVVTQAGYMHKICLGTYLYMTSSDSFDGMKHNITMTGYTPMVELEEKLPPLGFHIIGITNRKHSGDAPMVTEAIKDIVTTYTRCEIENRTVIQKPLLNDFVAGTNDNFLTVINNILNASSLGQYILTVDEWGTIIVKDKPVLEDAIPTYIYTDDNSSILLPSLDTNDDIYGIPNVVEVLYTGDKRLPAIRVIVKNEDPTSIVSIPARGREIAKRFTITNIAAPVNDYSEAAVKAQVTAQAERLLEAASTINKTISYSHGYCDVKVGDTVLINYERAGVTGIRAKVVSQRISCKPGCQVDEQAVYTKKLWNRGV